METYVVWLQIFFKQQLKKPLYWFQILLLIAGVCCMVSIRFPGADNCKIGYCFDQKSVDDWLLRDQSVQDDTLRFCFYEEEEQLYAAVRSGYMDCGFVLPARMGEGASIESVVSPISTKNALAKLTVFEVCYRILSEDILLAADQKLYGEAGQEREELLLQKNREIIASDRVFDIQMIEVPVETKVQSEIPEQLPVQGIAGMFVMMIMLLADGIIFDPKSRGLLKALSLSRRRAVCMLYSLAAGLLPALASLMLIGITGRSRGIAAELLAMFLLIIWTQLWICLLIRRREVEGYHVELVLFLAVQLLVCPVFVDLSGYLPALKVLRLLFPLGIYLI